MTILTASLMSLLVWLATSLYHFIKNRSIKLFHFPFSERNYYILMSGFPLAIIAMSLYRQSAQPIAQFLFFAVAGVFGETFFSLWWHSLFGQRFWVYTTETLYHSYTSVLNFIPWGVSGVISLEIAQIILGKKMFTNVFANNKLYLMLFVVYGGSLLLQYVILLLIREFRHSEFKFHEVTWINYTFFVFPFLSVVTYLGLQFSYNFFLLALVFGSFFPFTEYMFGKVSQLFISKKLWNYTYVTYDNGHFSPLALIPFVMVGYWFLILYGFFGRFLFT